MVGCEVHPQDTTQQLLSRNGVDGLAHLLALFPSVHSKIPLVLSRQLDQGTPLSQKIWVTEGNVMKLMSLKSPQCITYLLI